MARIEVYRKGKRTADIELPREGVVIGRDVLARVRLDDKLVSRTHARIAPTGGAWTVEDLETKNGTFVNGTREFRKPLVDKDRLEIGPFVLVFRLAPEERVPWVAPSANDHLPTPAGVPTIQVPPKEFARVREEARSLLGPHLALEGKENSIYPLRKAETIIGEGAEATHRITGTGRAEAAEFALRPDGSCVARKLGWFGAMKVNGEKASERELAEGDVVELGSVRLVFRRGAGLHFD